MATAVLKLDLKISDRARALVEQMRDIQKVQKPHDIRSNIPMVDWTNPAKFPPYVFREYPKMPLLDGNLPIKINETGDLLMFYSAEDEDEFMGDNPEIAEEIERNMPAKQYASALAAKDEELSELRERLRKAGLDDGTKKPAAKAGGGLASAVRKAPENGTDSDGGLREQVKAAETAAPAGNPLKNKKKAAA
jgi:hypothetical protein